MGARLSEAGAGAALVYAREGTTWSEEATLVDPDERADMEQLGASVALGADAQVAIVGAPMDAHGRGAARVFLRSGATWSHVTSWSGDPDATSDAVLEALAGAGARLSGEIARAALVGGLGETGEVNAHGDRVRRLDVLANDLLLAALESSGVVSAVASEELPVPVGWPRAIPMPLAVCLDPLDGSLNSDVAGVLGTIFGIRPAAPDAAAATVHRTAVVSSRA